MKSKLTVFVTLLFLLTAFPVWAEYKPHFLIDSKLEWDEVWLSPDTPTVEPLNQTEWDEYMSQANSFLEEGNPYPPTNFLPAQLYVYDGGGSGGTDPEDAGLVMVWGDNDLDPGNYASAWKYDFGVDPDLSNSIIQVTVTPPSASGINTISFGIQDAAGNIRSWWWNVPGVIPHDVPTTVRINTAITGLTAATPSATGYANNPGFNIKQAIVLLADENSQWVGGPVPVPSPGQQLPGLWNYWHDLVAKPNTSVNKGYHTKWSQPPVEIEDGLIDGWDEISGHIQPFPIVADDWLCEDERPITDVHWWGSFLGWTQPYLPAVVPKGFHIGIWTDVPAGVDQPFSHPGTLVWENYRDGFVWNFAGYDLDPRELMENEACFQFNQLLSQDEWFYQEPDPTGEGRVYWLSIAAIYEPGVTPTYPWGWKTRSHFYNDDSIRITDASSWPPVVGSAWTGGQPIEYEGVSWDVSFELTTNEPDPQPDSDGDGIPDAVDNCPNFYSLSLSDVDADGVGDVCDNCPITPNGSQADTDFDSVGDLCDNCLSVCNVQQGDVDGDGEGDVCDLDPGCGGCGSPPYCDPGC